jgi:hypothetical protein
MLGVAALAVVWFGAVAHRQAPVVIGGVVLALVALHELVLLWQRVQGWIPLAVAERCWSAWPSPTSADCATCAASGRRLAA